jgi:hypothetical protein
MYAMFIPVGTQWQRRRASHGLQDKYSTPTNREIRIPSGARRLDHLDQLDKSEVQVHTLNPPLIPHYGRHASITRRATERETPLVSARLR